MYLIHLKKIYFIQSHGVTALKTLHNVSVQCNVTRQMTVKCKVYNYHARSIVVHSHTRCAGMRTPLKYMELPAQPVPAQRSVCVNAP